MGMGINSTIYWTIKRPVMTIAALIFHAAFIIMPLFLNAHAVIFNTAFGFDWPGLPQGIANGITIVVIICFFFFLLRRLAVKKIRNLTRPSEYWMLVITFAPFLTGFLAHYNTQNYNFWLILHILSAEIMLAALFASIIAFILRYFKKKADYKNILPYRIMTFGFLVLCFIILGFTSKSGEWTWPAGSFVTLVLPHPLFQLIADAHFLMVLTAVVFLIPSGLLRHVSASAVNFLYWPRKQMGSLGDTAQEKIGVNTIADFSWKQHLDTEACVSCGKCIENCPAAIAGKPLSPRNILQKIFGQVEKDQVKDQPLLNQIISGDEIWSCTTCMACVQHCPVYTDPADIIIELRRNETIGQGNLPKEVRPMIRNLELFGDTYGKGPAHRTDWVHDNPVPVLSKNHPQTDILLWVGCSGAFHPRYTQVYRSMVQILNAARVDFAILGKKEYCCGDQARRLGHESVFSTLARKNIDEINKYQFEKIVTLCPHCMHSLKHEYGAISPGLDVIHASELVESLINENKIKLKYPRKSLLTIHDPCYLGRVNKTFQPVRNISTAIEGTTLQELERRRENGFCCGAGGGQMWLHDTVGRHINHIRAEQIIDSGADTVVTACPFCLTMLDDGINAAEHDKPVMAVDIIEMVASSIG